MKWLRNFNEVTLELYKQLDAEKKAVFDRLHLAKPRVSKNIKKGVWGNDDSATYGTKEILNAIVDKEGEFYLDLRLPWAYRQASSYGLNYLDLYKICPWIDPHTLDVYDYNIGYNNHILTLDGIKSAEIRSDLEWYKPSVQHIVPTAIGGPADNIENIMVMPLRLNILIRDMSPRERKKILGIMSSSSYLSVVEEAEDKFYRQKTNRILTEIVNAK